MGHRIEMYSVPLSKTADETLEKWNNGQDFKICGGAYCSIRDFEELKKHVDIIELKYIDENDKVHYINLFTHLLAGVTTYV